MFAQFTQEDKEAFFALLDEYFESRPHLLGGGSNAINNSATPVVAALQRSAAQNPQAAANIVSAGARGFNKWNNSAAETNSPASQAADASSNGTNGNGFSPSGMGKVAAAAASLQAKGLSRFGGGPPAPPPPPPQPSRGTPPATVAASRPPAPVVSSRPGGPYTPSDNTPPAPPPPPAPPRRALSNTNTPDNSAGTAGMVTRQRMGDVDTSSPGAVFGSILPKKHFGSPPPPPAVSIPAALPRPKNNFAPPPVRKVTPAPAPPPEPEPEPEEEEVQQEEEAEWAQALYAYSSTDPGDLPLKEKQHVRIIERTSDDWWTGEVNGKRGLFPSSYVQVLQV